MEVHNIRYYLLERTEMGNLGEIIRSWRLGWAIC